MTIGKLVRRNPAMTYGMIGAALWIALWGLGVHQAASGVQAAALLLGKVLLLPALAVQEVLLAFNGGSPVPWQGGLSILLGLALCLALDVAYRRLRSGRP